MSRPAWLAAGASCCWVFFLRKSGWELLKKRVIRHNKSVIFSCVILFLIISLLPTLGGIFHPDQSANRMLMWNVTTKAILNQPVTGTGMGGFPALFAQTQADYFASGKASDTELAAAGCPKFAYNDYLQMGLEFRSPGCFFCPVDRVLPLLRIKEQTSRGYRCDPCFIALLHVFLSVTITVVLDITHLFLGDVRHTTGEHTKVFTEKLSAYRSFCRISRLYPVLRTAKLL